MEFDADNDELIILDGEHFEHKGLEEIIRKSEKETKWFEKQAEYKHLVKIEEMEEQNYNMVLSECFFYPHTSFVTCKVSEFNKKLCG